jgi:hypothetical protein
VRLRWPGMRYTKAALTVFGLGLVLGFALVVVGGYPRLERVASALMALGLVALPLALFGDGRGVAFLAWIAARLSGRGRKKTRGKSKRAVPRKPPARSRSPARAARRTRG